MKKILGNIWIKIFLGLIAGVLVTSISYVLMIVFWIKYSGLGLFGMGLNGDKSPITFAIAIAFAILTLTFPVFVWVSLNKFGSLKSLSEKTKIITFIIFATLPLWTYFGWGVFEKIQYDYKTYRSTRDTCIVKNGVNKLTISENTKEFECKAGVFNGLTKTYNSNGILIYEVVFLNGKENGVENVYYDSGKIKITTIYKKGIKEGAEVFYNEDGSTSLYIINNRGKSKQIYFQGPEKNLDGDTSLKSQNFLCKNQEKYLSKNYKYSCTDNAVNGDFIKDRGNLLLKVHISNGVLDGIYEEFLDGKLYRHLEFKNGDLDGKAYRYSTNEWLEYEGQYINGLQDGVFRRYDYKGNVLSEVVFENGKITKINIQ